MKKPKFFCKIAEAFNRRPKKRLQATARAARPAMDDYGEEEPTTNLSSAFVVVLVLHIVAVGGIYAFNSIKQSRRDREAGAPTVEQTEPAPQKAVAKNGPVATSPPAVHPTAPATHPAETVPVPALAPGKLTTGRQYQVKGNDTLTKIAFAYGVTAMEIMEANHLKEGAVLHPGQTLAIPAAKTPARIAETHKTEATPKQADVPPTTTTPGFYTVKKGDTPTSIAHSFGLTTAELLKANKITNARKLQIGQTLKVPPRKS